MKYFLHDLWKIIWKLFKYRCELLLSNVCASSTVFDSSNDKEETRIFYSSIYDLILHSIFVKVLLWIISHQIVNSCFLNNHVIILINFWPFLKCSILCANVSLRTFLTCMCKALETSSEDVVPSYNSEIPRNHANNHK